MFRNFLFIISLLTFHAEVFSSALEEKKELESFFRHLCVKSECGYTIFGEKPMSFYSYFIKPPKEFLIHSSIYDPPFEKWYGIYSKYQHLFFTDKFLIVDQLLISKKFPTSAIVRDLIVINKEAFIKTIQDNQELFNKRLRYDVRPDVLLKRIEAGESVLQKVLQEDEVLWGVLLGFGAHNAQMFERWEQTQDDRCLPNLEFDNLASEREYFEKNFNGYDFVTPITNEIEIISRVTFPGFTCDSAHPETIKIIKHYRDVRKKLCEILDKPDFCDIVVERLGIKIESN